MKQNTHSNSIQLLIEQLSHEIKNCNLYLSFSSTYLASGLPLLSHYFHERAMEERVHSDWILNYLRSRNICFVFPAVEIAKYETPAVETLLKLIVYENCSCKDIDLIRPFVQTVAVERDTTVLINKILTAAISEKDILLESWLQQNGSASSSDSITNTSCGKLLREQDEEESISNTILSIACQECDWLTKEQSIINYYKTR